MKKPAILSISCILLLGILITAYTAFAGRRPYKDLNASDISTAAVRLSPPDKTVQIVEIKELVEYLKDVVIYHEDNAYTEYDGQGVTFMLTMRDGTQTSIMAYGSFLVIDGVGYKTKVEPCEALNNYANRLLNREDAMIVLKEPPRLAVVCGKTCFNTLLGTYSWQKRNPDGTAASIESDSAHPLSCIGGSGR